MSVFKVQLANASQGLLDVDMVTGQPVSVSRQRTVYVTGPNLTWRKLNDGDVFTDSNYYKRFCYPQARPEDCFLTLLSDDGSVYQPSNYNQTMPNNQVTSNYPLAYNLTIAAGTTFTAPANTANILGDTNSTAVYANIQNTGSGDVKMRIDGLATSIIDLPAGVTKIFEIGEFRISKLEFDATATGTGATTVAILLSVAAQNFS